MREPWADAPRVGSGQIGVGDQRFGAAGPALVGRKPLAAPFGRLAVDASDPCSRDRYCDHAEGAEHLPVAMAVTMTGSTLQPGVAGSLQRRRHLLLQKPLDQRAELLANPGLHGVEPIRSQDWNRRLVCDILRHGV